MGTDLRYDLSRVQLRYDRRCEAQPLDRESLAAFNQCHRAVLGFYGLELASGLVMVLQERVNGRSNLGTLRNRQLREAAILAAALPAAAVAADGRGALRNVPEQRRDGTTVNRLKRHNDRTAAQVMSEVLQLTADALDVGEEVVIESAVTEGVRAKPGKEPGGNPTIPVGALFGKEEHCWRFGHGLSTEVTRLSLGTDVIDGTGKSVQGAPNSLTAVLLTETNFKRHLPDIYVQRWMSGAAFPEFNPREVSVEEEAAVIARAYGMKDVAELTAFFLDRPRHLPAMERLNARGVATPSDRDGDLFPAVILGLDGIQGPDGRGFHSMVGEIGGSAEWVVGALPLVWRGGQSLGMLASQSALTRDGLLPDELWRQRFQYTEEELILLSDARFEQKPFFTVFDLAENPMAGGVSAFCAVTDNHFFPSLQGVRLDRERGTILTDTLVVNSLGQIAHWQLMFRCTGGFGATAELLRTPKRALGAEQPSGLAPLVREMVQDDRQRFRLRQFFVNEYYPAIIQTSGRMVVLEKTIAALIERGAFSDHDRAIVRAVVEAIPAWFATAF